MEMVNVWQSLNDKIKRTLQGRYGVDTLNKDLSWIALILVLLGFKIPYLNLLGLIVLAYSYFRIFSKDIQKRSLENYKYIIFRNKVIGPFKTFKLLLFGDKQSKYYRCPNCRQVVRVPKGRGQIEIHCPKCKHHFIKKT